METNEQERVEPPADDTFTFRVKRSHFYAVAVPLAFLLGLAIGYLAWGQNASTVSAPAAQTATQLEGAASQTQASLAEEVARQMESIDRVDVSTGADDPAQGPDDAPVTIIEFADFECPFCQRHFLQVYPRLQAEYPDLIRYVYKDLPLTSIHPNAMSAALAAQCASEQGEFWAYHDLLFSGSLGLGESSYVSYASQLDLDGVEFSQCLEEERYSEQVTDDMSEAFALGVSSTPTFFINGVALVGAQPYEVFAAIIDYELERLEAGQN